LDQATECMFITCCDSVTQSQYQPALHADQPARRRVPKVLKMPKVL